MRILIVVPPLVGHSSPLLSLAEELVRRGHEVAWAGIGSFHRDFLPAGARLFECRTGWAELPQRPPTLMGPGALKFFWEEVFVPLADGMAEDVEAAVQSFAPDVMVVDQQALAGAMVAERLGIPWITSATTMIELVNPLAALPKVLHWRDELLLGLRQRIGNPAAVHDPLFSPWLTIAFGLEGLFEASTERPGSAWAGHPLGPVEFVGPVFRPAGLSAEDERVMSWVQKSTEPTVLVALGTTNVGAGNRFLHAAAGGLAAAGVRCVFADPAGALRDLPSPPGRLVAPRIPQQQLLEHTAAFINHGGYNSVCEALWFAVPMVLAGIRDDQPIIAERAAAYGVGVAVRFSRSTAQQIADATRTVLDDPVYQQNARPYQEALRTAGGLCAAVDAIERVMDHAVAVS
ncbi:glycosyltransferase [Acaricomes phytoseiuli]|uniref:glycosyltransferase n=1 Tax=Acaricomes phytoseiuli TaxID=291968 RepID=UPI00035C0D2C|nr:glycosyltransferase [Acaricomes phytoseiuli]MCW1249510.1 glycosyltransferase [Acaricomes phytoseiuli]